MASKSQYWDIGEFASYSIDTDEENQTFRIIISGPTKYEDLISTKINDIRITKDDLKDLVE